MIKKSLIAALSVVLVSGVLFGSNAVSYVKTACSRVSSAAEDSVPVEFQIDRARQMVKDLAPEIRHSMHVIAKEEIEVDNLSR